MTIYFYKKVDTMSHQIECRVEISQTIESLKDIKDVDYKGIIQYLTNVSFAITTNGDTHRIQFWVNPEVYENLRTNPDTIVHLRKLGITRWEYHETTIWEDKCND